LDFGFWIGRELRAARWKREHAWKKCHVTDGPVDATLRRMHIEMDFPESAFSALRLSPAQFARELRLAAALKWYEAGMISQSKAAELAAVPREAFLLSAGRFQVSAVQTTPEELAEELARD